MDADDDRDASTRLARRPEFDAPAISSAPSAAHLVLLCSPEPSTAQPGDRYRVGPTECSIGREGGNNIVVPCPTVSKFHARISPESGEWVLTDLHSTNGTRIQGRGIHSHTLRNGDSVAFGRSLFRFLCGPETEASYRAELEELAAREPRTGLTRWRRFSEYLATEVARHREYGAPVTLVAMAIDGMGSIAGELGPLATDDVLAHVGQVLRHQIPAHPWEHVALADGAVVAMLLPELDTPFAVDRARAAVQALARSPLSLEGHARRTLTASAGVASAGEHAAADSLWTAALQCLAQAQAAGQGRVAYGGATALA